VGGAVGTLVPIGTIVVKTAMRFSVQAY